MIIAVMLENGEVRVYDDLASARNDLASYTLDLISEVIVLYDKDGTWLEPVTMPGPRRCFGLRKREEKVVDFRPNKLPRLSPDPIGLALAEACTLVPNRHFKSLDDLRRSFPTKGSN